MNHEILIEDETEGGGAYEALLRQTISATLAQQGVLSPCELSVLLTDEDGIQEINLSQRGLDSPTDVLSFPMFPLAPGTPPGGELADPETGRIPLGDMVISLPRAQEQGEEYGHGTRREIAYLAVHSVLHLLGYDHMEEGDKQSMRRAEEDVLSRMGITREEDEDADQ